MYPVELTYYPTREFGLSPPLEINPLPVALDFIEQANPPYFDAFLSNWDDSRLQNASFVTNDPPTPCRADVFFNFEDQPSFPDEAHVNDSHSQEIPLPEARVRAVSSLEFATSLVGLDSLGSSVVDKVQGIDPIIGVILCDTRANLQLTPKQLGDHAGIDPHLVDIAEMNVLAIDWLTLKKIVYALLQEIRNWQCVAQSFPHNQGLHENQILDSAIAESKGFNIFTVKEIVDNRTPHIRPSIVRWIMTHNDYARLSRVSNPLKISDEELIRPFLDLGETSRSKMAIPVVKKRKRNEMKREGSVTKSFSIPFELLQVFKPEKVLERTRRQLKLTKTSFAELLSLKTRSSIQTAEKKIASCRPLVLKKIVDKLFDLLVNSQMKAEPAFLEIKKIIDLHCPYNEKQLQMLDELELSLDGVALSNILLEIKYDKCRGYKVEDLAHKLNVKGDVIRRAENGTKISPEPALSLILALGIDIKKVLTNE